jgi:hypothetical protein
MFFINRVIDSLSYLNLIRIFLYLFIDTISLLVILIIIFIIIYIIKF